MEEGREAYRRVPGHGRPHPYEGPTSPRDQFYGGPPRDTFRRPSYDQRFSSPLGRAGSFNGPVSPDHERLRGYSPERRPYSPDHDRRAYSPDRVGDRDRAPRYQIQERHNGYRPREEGFRREPFGYRGDDNRSSGRSRDSSPDHHHGHHSMSRDQLPSLSRDRGLEPDLHTRPLSREGTPLDVWASERSGKPPHLHPSHSHGVSRGAARASSTAPSSSGPLRVATNADNGQNMGDLEAGEVAPGPGSSSREPASRPSPDHRHAHHHSSNPHQHQSSSHHGHNSHGHAQQSYLHGGPGQHVPHRTSGTQLLLRPGGASVGWDPRSNHSGPDLGGHSGSGPRDAPPPPAPPCDTSGREAGREGGREANGRGDGARDFRDVGREPRDVAKPSHRSAAAGVRSPSAPGRPDVGFSRDVSARDREREREKGLRGSPSFGARTSIHGGAPPSPGRSPRVASSDGATYVGTAATAVAQEPLERRWLAREGSGGQPSDRGNSSGAGAVPPPGASQSAATGAQRRTSSSAAAEPDWRRCGGADAPGQLRPPISGDSSHRQATAGAAAADNDSLGPPRLQEVRSKDAGQDVSAEEGKMRRVPAAEPFAEAPPCLSELEPHEGGLGTSANDAGGSDGAGLEGSAAATLPGIPSNSNLEQTAALLAAGPAAVAPATTALPAVAQTGALCRAAAKATSPVPAAACESATAVPHTAPSAITSDPAAAMAKAPRTCDPSASGEAEPGEVLSEGEPPCPLLPGLGLPADASQAQQFADPFGSAARQAADAAAPGAGAIEPARQPGGREEADGVGVVPERVPSTAPILAGLGAASVSSDDPLGTERKSSLTIRRFGFGRVRRSLPAKSAGDAAAEEGGLPGTSGGGALERTFSGSGRGQSAGEAVDGELQSAPAPAMQALAFSQLTDAAAPSAKLPTAADNAAAADDSTDFLGSLPPILTVVDPVSPKLPSCLPSPMTAPAAAPPPSTIPAPGGSAPAAVGFRAPAGVHPLTPSGSAAGAPMEVDYAHATSQDVAETVQQEWHQQLQQPQFHQQQADLDAVIRVSNPVETVAALSLRIEHLETEITDLERQLSSLVSAVRLSQSQAAALEAAVGALDEQLLQDTSSGGGESGSESDEAANEDLEADVDRSGASATRSGSWADLDALDTLAVEAPALAAMFTAPVDAGHIASSAPEAGAQAAVAPHSATRRAHEASTGEDNEMAAARPQGTEAAAAAADQALAVKPRGRPRSTAKVRAAEAAAAAAAAEDRRKVLEQRLRTPPDGLLHLPAQQFKPRALQVVRGSIAAWREEVLRLLPDGLAARVRSAIETAAAQQMRLATAAPMPGGGRWATIVPLTTVRVEPMYRQPQDLTAFHANVERHAVISGVIGRYLRQRRQLVAAKQGALVAQYTRHMAAYKEYMQTEGRRPPAPPQPLVTGRGSGAAGFYGMYAASRAVASYNPYAYSHSDVIRSDLDEQRLLNNFIAVEQLKHMCALPDMVLDPWERRWRAYDNRNGLVRDPVRELEEERMVKSWAEEERTQFMDRFLQHPKDFRKIASYLPGRSPGDCVAFFYKNQKLDEFGTVRRKQQLKKRRLQADMRKLQYAPLLVAPMIARQRAMGPGGGLGGDLGVRGGNRGRSGVRSTAMRGPRGTTLMDPDRALGLGSLAMGSGGLSLAGNAGRPLPGGPSGLHGFQSIMASTHRAAAVVMGAGAETRDLPPAPLLPPISSAGMSQPPTQVYPQQQAPTLPTGGSTGGGWTDEDFIECYRQHGKCWESYCRHLGIRSESAAKQYYYRHKERLGLDRIQPNTLAAAAGMDASGMAVIAAVSAAGPGQKLAAASLPVTDDEPASEAVAAVAAAAAAPTAGTSGAAEAPTPLAAGSSPLRVADDTGTAAADEQVPQALQEPQPAPGYSSLILIPKGASGRRRGPARVPASAASLTNGPLLGGAVLESSEASRQEGGRQKQDLDSDMRSDSEYDAAAQAGAVGAGPEAGTGALISDAGTGEAARSSLPQHIDLLAALRNPGSSSLTQLLRGGLLQAAGGGQGGRVLSHLLLQQQHLEQRLEQREGSEQQQGLGLNMDLNLNMLGSITGTLQGVAAVAGSGGASSAGLGLFTGPSAGSQCDDTSAQLSSPGDDGGAGAVGGVGIGIRRFGANYWSREEKDIFYEVFQVYGRDWARLAEAIPTKSTSQIKTYFHNYKAKLGFDKMEPPAVTVPPPSRKGQGRVLRDSAVVASSAAAAAAAAMAAASAPGNPAGEEERPAKRQATGAGLTSGLNGQLGLGDDEAGADGIALPRGSVGNAKAASPPLPVMDLHALASLYSAQAQPAQGPDLVQLLAFAASLQGGASVTSGTGQFGAEGPVGASREGDGTRIFGGSDGAGDALPPVTGGACGASRDRPGASSEAPQHGGVGGSQQTSALSLLGSRPGDTSSLQALALSRGPLAGLSALQMQALNGVGSNSGVVSLLAVGGLLSQQQQSAAQTVKLQALNLEHGSSDVFAERERERGTGGLSAFRLATTAGGSGGLVLQDPYAAALAQQLNMNSLPGPGGERDRDRSRADRGGQLALVAQEGAIAENAAPNSAPSLELLAAKGGGQSTTQALDLATPAQVSPMARDAPAIASASGAQIPAVLEPTGTGGHGYSDYGAAAAALAAAAAMAGKGGGVRSARTSETTADGGLNLAALGRESDRWNDGNAKDGGEPASKRQKRLSREAQGAQQSLDLAVQAKATSPALSPSVGDGAVGRVLTAEEQVAQHLLQQFQQQAAVGQRLASADLLRVQEQRQAPQQRGGNAATALNLGLTGLQVLATSGAGGSGGGSGVLRLVPLQTPPANAQQQQDGGGGVARIQLGAPVAVSLGQGQAVSVTDVLSSMHAHGGRDLLLQAASGPGAGAFGLGGAGVLDRLLTSAQDASLGVGVGQYNGLHAGRGAVGMGWPVLYGNQLVSLGQRAPLNLAVLLQQQQQQAKEADLGGQGSNR